MIHAHIAIALALLALVAGIGFSWWHFSEDLHRQEREIEDLQEDLFDMTEERDQLVGRVSDAEQSLELVLGEGESRPLTAPLQVIRGAR